MSKALSNSAKYEMRDITTLINWENNPRTITKDEFNRLKEQIDRLGVYKPLLINQQNIVLGGNMRLRALKEMGVKDIMCSIVLTDNPAQMMEYALSDNDQAGVTDELAVAEFTTLHPIKSELFAINSKPMKLISDLEKELGQDFENKEIDTEGLLNDNLITCPKCKFQFENKNHVSV